MSKLRGRLFFIVELHKFEEAINDFLLFVIVLKALAKS
jgi:hypothetical protein